MGHQPVALLVAQGRQTSLGIDRYGNAVIIDVFQHGRLLDPHRRRRKVTADIGANGKGDLEIAEWPGIALARPFEQRAAKRPVAGLSSPESELTCELGIVRVLCDRPSADGKGRFMSAAEIER